MPDRVEACAKPRRAVSCRQYETSVRAALRRGAARFRHGGCPVRFHLFHSAPREARQGHPVDRGRPSVPDPGRRVDQFGFFQHGVHGAVLAQAGRGQHEYRPGGGDVGTGRAGTGQVRLCAGGRRHPRGPQEPLAPDLPVVWKLEERRVHVYAAVGEEESEAISAVSGGERAGRSPTFRSSRKPTGRRTPTLSPR